MIYYIYLCTIFLESAIYLPAYLKLISFAQSIPFEMKNSQSLLFFNFLAFYLSALGHIFIWILAPNK